MSVRTGRGRRDVDPRALLDPRTSIVGRGERLVRAERRPTLVGHIVGLTIMVVGLGVFASGTVDLIDGGANTVVLLSSGLVMSVVGGGDVADRRSPPSRSGCSTCSPR